MSNPKAREEEYVRGMKERGYIPSLAGMDDGDIEWALQKMDRGRVEQEPEYQFNKTFQPPDRDFAERMFKMFARPFDPNWKMPDLDGPEFRQPPKPVPAFEQAMGGARQPEWGGGDTGAGMKRMSGNANNFEAYASSFADTSGSVGDSKELKMAKGGKVWPYVNPAADMVLGAEELAKEVEKEALARGDNPELAKKKADDARGRFQVWQTAVIASTGAADARWGTAGAAAAGTTGTIANHFVIKDWIKKQVLENTEDFYNTMFPGNMPPGPG